MPLAVEIPAGEAGLRENSVALCHNVHALDAAKLRRKIGDLGPFYLARIERRLSRIAGPPRPAPLAPHPAFYQTARLTPHGSVAWGEDDRIELCADALYLQLTGKYVEEAMPGARKIAVNA